MVTIIQTFYNNIIKFTIFQTLYLLRGKVEQVVDILFSATPYGGTLWFK